MGRVQWLAKWYLERESSDLARYFDIQAKWDSRKYSLVTEDDMIFRQPGREEFQRRDIKTCSNPISLEIYSWAFVETTFPNLDGGLRLIQLVQHRSSCVLHRPSLSTKLSKNSRHRRGLSS
jgi:hypothetical protein